MIQRIIPAANSNNIIRSTLKPVKNSLGILSGSSMSGWSAPRTYEVEMIIPGGLNMKEKAYYLLKGKLPKSVYERWIQNNGENVPHSGDELVTVNRTYEGGVVNITEGPHDALLADSHGSEHIDISANDIIGNGDNMDIPSSGDDLSAFDIWRHLTGF